MGFHSLLNLWAKNNDKNVNKDLSGKSSPSMKVANQKFSDYAKKSATDALKSASKRKIQKTAEIKLI